MTEDDVRALVREAVERHLGRPGTRGAAPRASSASHPSHIVLHVAAGSDIDDGQCVIEPAVACNHCNFCKSLGH